MMIILITLPTLSDSVYGFDLSDYENQAEYWGLWTVRLHS